MFGGRSWYHYPCEILPSRWITVPVSRVIAVILRPWWAWTALNTRNFSLKDKYTLILLSSGTEAAVLSGVCRLFVWFCVCVFTHTYEAFGPQKGIHKKHSSRLASKKASRKVMKNGLSPEQCPVAGVAALMRSAEGFVFPLVVRSPELSRARPIPAML